MRVDAVKKGFGQYYEKAQNPEWAEHYLPYDKFKGKLKEFVRRRVRLNQLQKRQRIRGSSSYIVGSPGDALDSPPVDGVSISPAAAGASPEQAGPKGGDKSKGREVELSVFVNVKETPLLPSPSIDEVTKTSLVSSSPEKIDTWNGLDKYATERYNSLERTLTTFSEDGETDAKRQLYETERSEFVDLLDFELLRVRDFYKGHEVRLEHAMKGRDETLGNAESRRELIEGVLEVYSFVCVNLIALRQILIRYDMFLKTFSKGRVLMGYVDDSYDFLHFGSTNKEFTPTFLSRWYLATRSNAAIASYLSDLFRHEGLLRIIGTLTAHLRDLHLNEAMNQDPDLAAEEGTFANTVVTDLAVDLHRFSTTVHKFDETLYRTQKSIEKASFGHRSFKDRCIFTLRHYFLKGAIIDSLGLYEPQFLLFMRGKTFQKEMKFFGDWRRTKDVFAEDEDTGGWTKYIPFALNFMSSVLYLMNYYIVEPSSTKYVNFLGGHDALVGMLIGAMPWAAFTSAVFYSIATNYNYKNPMIFSGCMISMGNLVYSAAYARGSLTLVFIGRAMCGLGEPRVINRRFVADTIPSAVRTAASATFAMGCAIGSALGPATAIALDRLKWELDLPLLGTLYVNGMTGPGYLMFIFWATYTVLTVLYFREPERVGLEEQKQRELALGSAVSQSSVDASSLLKSSEGDDDDTDDSEHSSTEDDMTPEKDDEVADSIISCLKAITPAVVICMLLELVSKFSLESLSSATSVLTKNRYGWQVDEVGTLGSINGLLVIPVSILVGWLSQYQQDRVLIIKLLAFSAAGSLILVDFTDFFWTESENYNEYHWLSVGPAHYVVGNLIFFSAIHAVESVNIAMFSKVVPVSMARGTFNCGLLATVVGTLGRSFGDMFIMGMGFISLRSLMNLLYFPVFCILLGCIALVRFNYDLFAV